MKRLIRQFLTVITAVVTIFLPTLTATRIAFADSANPAITEYPIPFGDGPGIPITTGPDGALWFAESIPRTVNETDEVVRLTTSGNYTQFPIPTSADFSLYGAGIYSITSGSDGAIWFTDFNTDQVERFTTSGQFSSYSVPSIYTSNQNYGDVEHITSGPDGALWFVMPKSGKIGRITTTGDITEYSLPSGGLPYGITTGPDGALWFTEVTGNKIGRITTTGDITEYSLPTPGVSPHDITVGPDGALWFTESGSNKIGRITTSGTVTEYPTPSDTYVGNGIITGPDGALWFPMSTHNGNLYEGEMGRITTSGVVNEYPVTAPQSQPTDLLGITAGPDGALWLTDDTNSDNQIVRVNPTLLVSSAPTITSPTSYTTGMRDPITPSDFTVTTTGDPTATITESGTLPQGISFVDNGDGTANFTGMASGNPTSNSTYPITITATNSAGSTTQNFTLTITTASSPLAFISSSTDTESFGVPFSYTVVTSGYPLPTSIHKVEGDGSLPPGVSLTDNGDGTATLSGTPDNTANGSYTFTLGANDSKGIAATQVFTMTITKAPLFKDVRAGQNPATVGTAYSLPVTATGTSPIVMTESGTLPNGLSFTDNGDGTATLSGTPQSGSGGTYPVTVTATNAYGTATTSFTVKVDEAPTITSADSATATVGSDFYFPVTSLGYPAPNYTLTGTLPAGLHFYPGPGTFGGTPEAGTEGTYPVTITATNSLGSDSQSFTVVVTP